ncbi:competence protein CoiA [Bacillus sp. SCS-153A]|uniref:competence protein CoiA n=1 Tax=Rossellomorea sedimentorum TaxID=3115294 RepID=UPI003906598A
MLTALNKRQKIITLTRLSSEEINKLKDDEFFCPECCAPLTIKAGHIKIPHFAHKSRIRCEGIREPETHQHMKGKTILFQHFSTFLPHVTLETYLPGIQQRPDLFIRSEGRRFAIEYQCSPISITDFAERTKGYIQAGIEPIWILGKRVKAKGARTIVLSTFQQSFIRHSPHAGYWLAYFNSDTESIHFFYNLSPVSSNTFTSETHSLSVTSIPFPFTLPSKNNRENQMSCHFADNKAWITRRMTYNRGVKDPFLRAVYLNRDHLMNLPEFIGLPTEHMILFKSHPVEWQYFLWCDVFKNKKKGTRILVEEITSCLNNRANSGLVHFRSLPLTNSQLKKQALEEYLLVLEKRDIIKKVSGMEYILLSPHTK